MDLPRPMLWRVQRAHLRPGANRAMFVLLFNACFVALLLLLPQESTLKTAVANVLQFLGPALALVICAALPGRLRMRGADYPFQQGVRRPVWLLWSGVGCFVLGQIVWTYYELVLHRELPLPSWADVFFLSAYPCLLAGILLLPLRPLSPAVRTRVLLDGIMIMVATATGSWYFLLGPLVQQGGGPALQTVIGLAYPVGDLVLIGCLLLLVQRVDQSDGNRAGLVLMLAFSIIIVTDTSFILRTLNDTYVTGDIWDAGWSVGYMLVALGAWMICVSPVSQAAAAVTAGVGSPRRLLWSLLPYTLVPAVVALGLHAWQTDTDNSLDPGVYIGGTVLIGLMLIRQVLAIMENNRLYSEVHRAYLSLERSHCELADANQRLEELATIDPLTSLPNHRAMVMALDAELERSLRWNQPFTVLFLDIDHFKALNDGYGHAAGDAALCEFGAVLRDNVRAVDVIGRWGGEEFVAVLPQADRDDALLIAERIRAAVAAHRFTEASMRLTCSIGLAAYPDDGTSRNKLVADADRAMYAAKRLGRNQVRMACDPAVTTLEGALPGSRQELALISTVDALAQLAALRDRYTGEHADNVAHIAGKLAQLLGCDDNEARLISLGARLHDIGKVALPDAVLQKPGRLTDEEWQLVRQHPVVGAEVMGRVPGLHSLVPIVRGHHERWDGTGYPDGLAGESIALGARIVAVVDAYAAMTTDRPYREARSVPSALEELKRCADTQFDPQVVDAMACLIAAQPTQTPPIDEAVPRIPVSPVFVAESI